MNATTGVAGLDDVDHRRLPGHRPRRLDDVAGYHRNNPNTTTPFPYFATQLELSNGRLTTWDPKITGNQSNADGGNNGVQAIYVDQSTSTPLPGRRVHQPVEPQVADRVQLLRRLSFENWPAPRPRATCRPGTLAQVRCPRVQLPTRRPAQLR